MNNDYLDSLSYYYEENFRDIIIPLNQMNNLALKDRNLYNKKSLLKGIPSKDKPWLTNYSDMAIIGCIPEEKCVDYLINSHKDNLDSVAINYYGKKIKYKELFEKINILADNLIFYGIKKSDVIPICGKCSPEVIILYYALNKIGAISYFINPDTKEKEMDLYLSKIKPKCFFCEDFRLGEYQDLIYKYKIPNVFVLSKFNFMPILKKMECLKDNNQKYANYLPKESINDRYNVFNNLFNKKMYGLYDTYLYQKNIPAYIINDKNKGFLIFTNDCINSHVHDLRLSFLDFNRNEKVYFLNNDEFDLNNAITNFNLALSSGMELMLNTNDKNEKIDHIIISYDNLKKYGMKLVGLNLISLEDYNNIINNFSIDDSLSFHIVNCKDRKKVTSLFNIPFLGGIVATSNNVDKNDNFYNCGNILVNSNIGIFNNGIEEGFNTYGELCINNQYLPFYYCSDDDKILWHNDNKRWYHTNLFGKILDNGCILIDSNKNYKIFEEKGTYQRKK